MILKLLGLFDLFSAIILIFSWILPTKIIIYASGYLVMKGLFFGLGGDFVSWFDFSCGIYLFLITLGFHSMILTVVALLYLFQKVAFSLLS